ncbi:hypothetical protein JCM16814_33130 [Desulfobaculum senezii]
MKPDTHNLTWDMTHACNLQCAYCSFPHTTPPERPLIPTEKVQSFLDATGKQWGIFMTGGEPLLYPNFSEVCRTLAKTHRLTLDTNLSLTEQVRELADTVPPERVQDIHASLHIEERERIGGTQQFIDNVRLLRKRGFRVKVNYVLHPTLVRRYPEDARFFKRHGITLVPRPFKGVHDGHKYPAAYSSAAKRIFAGTPDAGRKMLFNFKGVPCNAGRTFIRMEPDGTVYRCSGDMTIMGNILDDVRLNDAPEPCRVSRCPCRGLDHVVLNDAQRAMVEGLRYSLVNDTSTAKAAFTRALLLNPSLSPAANNLGVIEFDRQNLSEAERHFAMALKNEPGNPTFTANLAATLAALGKREQAISICRALPEYGAGARLTKTARAIECDAPCPPPRISLALHSCGV